MRILIITESVYPSIDGVVTRMIESVRHMLRVGHEVAIVLPYQGENYFEGAKIYDVATRKLPLYRRHNLVLPSKQVAVAINEFNPDVIHVVNPMIIGLIGIKHATKFNFPLVVSYHSNIAQYLNRSKFDNKLLHRFYWQLLCRQNNVADINLSTSETMRQLLISKGIERLYVLGRGVDTMRFHPKFRNESLRLKLLDHQENKLLLLYVGRLTTEKNIDSLQIYLDKLPQARLLIVGDGPDRNRLERLFKHQDVKFCGYMEGNALSEIYASADLFVFPSLSASQSLVILEAMASGLPVLAAKSGPINEQIKDYENGLRYENGDVYCFCQFITTMKQTQVRKEMSIKARQTAQSFSWKTTCEQLLDYYHLAIARKERLRKQYK